MGWTAPANDGGNTVYTYALRWKKTADSTWIGGTIFNNQAQGLTVWNIARGAALSYTLASLDNDAEYEVQVKAWNAPGGSAWSDSGTGTPTSGEAPANNAPAFDDGATTTRSFAENTAAGQNIDSPVAATDADSGDTLTYSLGGTDASSFDIVATSGQLRTKSGVTYDYETKSSYTVTVSVSDGKDSAGNTDTATDATITVTINLTDVNEAPVFTSTTTTFSTAENATAVGTVSAADEDTADSVTYALSGTDASLFSISNAGVITFDAAPDFETPRGGSGNDSNAYTFTVTANGGTGDRRMTATQDLTVNVTDVNERPTAHAGQNQNVNEGDTVTLDGRGSSDPDAGTTLTYTWTPPAGITLSSNTAAQPTFTAPNRVADYNLVFLLSVSDGTLSSTATDSVTIIVSADNDPPTLPANWLTDQAATIGSSFTYQFDAVTDPEGVTPTYTAQRVVADTASAFPNNFWLSFNANTRTFSGTPEAADAGTLTIRVTASDGVMSASADFTLTVVVGVDYDTDDDGLIEVDSLAKLDAIRWDLCSDEVRFRPTTRM